MLAIKGQPDTTLLLQEYMGKVTYILHSLHILVVIWYFLCNFKIIGSKHKVDIDAYCHLFGFLPERTQVSPSRKLVNARRGIMAAKYRTTSNSLL